jgi:GntR family transcriptional regulator, transcriptional repressor for pyruvate dehydrogenase complex
MVMKKKTPATTRPRRAGVAAPPALESADVSSMFDPVERAPAYTKVSSAIEHKILSRVLRDGDKLPAELELAQQFRVHRSTVREALRQLESSGLVARPAGAKRLIVSRPEASKVASGMRQALVMHQVSFVDVWEAMMVIEPEVAAFAAMRRTQADLLALTQTSEAFRDSPEGDPDSVNIVGLFFEQIGAASRNQVLVLAKQSLAQVLAPSLARMIDTVPQARARITDAQKRIINAVRDKNSEEARKWMSKHVRDFKRGYEVAGISPDTPISV